MDESQKASLAEARKLIQRSTKIIREVRLAVPKTNVLTRNALLTLIKTLDLMIEALNGWSAPAKEVDSLYNSVCDEE